MGRELQIRNIWSRWRLKLEDVRSTLLTNFHKLNLNQYFMYSMHFYGHFLMLKSILESILIDSSHNMMILIKLIFSPKIALLRPRWATDVLIIPPSSRALALHALVILFEPSGKIVKLQNECTNHSIHYKIRFENHQVVF